MRTITIIFYLLTQPFFAFAQITPEQMVEKMGRGINMGNVMSASIEGNWAPAFTESYFQDVANAGFTTVRIPIDFLGTRTSGNTSVYSKQANTSHLYTGNASGYIIDATYLNRVEEVINWGLNQNLVVILDFHGKSLKDEFLHTFSPKDKWTDYYTEPTSAKRAADNQKFRAIWTQIANRFKNHSYDLLFEIVNEPYFFLTDAEMDVLNTDIINIIRNSGANNNNRNIVITGGTKNAYEAPLQIGNTVLNSDNHLIATFHYYLPRDFTASASEEHNDFDWGTVADEQAVDTHFQEVKDWATLNNIPVFLGEFGADNESGINYSKNTLGDFGGPDANSRAAFHSYVANKAIALGFAFTAWDAGDKSGKTIYKVEDRSWVENVKNALLESTLSNKNIEDEEFNTTIYPNPAQNKVYINSKNTIKKVEIYNALGAKQNTNFFGNSVVLNNLIDGSYMLEISFLNKIITKHKLLIKN
ncbi:cellulase family glycosylhydrolase [Wenyingzhuangia sp. IMCC45467]